VGVLATKRLHPKIGLQLSKVLPASLAALRIVNEIVGIDPELIGDKRQHVRRRGFLRAKHPPRKSQVGEMHRKAKAIRIPASLPYHRQIFN
jgi:Ni,Fe-hydrogenase III component G